MKSPTRSRKPASIGSNHSSRRPTAISASEPRTGNFALLLVMAWSPPALSAGIVWVSAPGDYATFNSNHTPDGTSARTIYYYRCLGSHAWRRRGGPICRSRPIRQDLLDRVAWTEIVKLLEEPSLIQSELDRRLEAARYTDPTKRREGALRRDLARLRKSIECLLTAYQEELLSLDELRHRMPELRRREYATRAELQSIAEQMTDRAAYLRLAETLAAFLARLRSSAETLDIIERQRVVRLLVKEILVSDDRIVIRHSIPLPTGPSGSRDPSPIGGYSSSAPGKSYLLRSGSALTTTGEHLHAPVCAGVEEARP